MAKVRVTIRIGSKVEKTEHESVAAAIDALESRMASIDAHREPQKILSREIAPAEQVAARGEVKGAGVYGGIDLRGDASAEAWSGTRWRRDIVETKGRESAYDALRRALS